jgi:hypothetical protein
MSEIIKNFIKKLDSSIFNKNHFEVDIYIDEFPCALTTWTNRELSKLYELDDSEENQLHLINDLENSIPVWQRDNDKWTPQMQTSFVLNVFKGFSTSSLILYCIKGDIYGKRNSNVLDGLQRITALYKFFNGKMYFNFNGEIISNKELLLSNDFKRHLSSQSIKLKIITFNNEIEAISHYIDMNENISHSTKDIDRARDYRQKLIDEHNYD